MYRIDGGAPRAFRDDLPALIGLGVPINAGGLANPSDGIVWIPYGHLAEANGVAIELSPGVRARVFHLRGLAGLRALARERGCAADGRFVS